MSDIVDRIGDALASGLPRREALKRVGMVVAAATLSAVKTSAKTPASSSAVVPMSMPTKTIRKVAIRVSMTSGATAIMTLPDKYSGVVDSKQGTVTLIPTIADNGEHIELSIYRGKRDDKDLLHNLLVRFDDRQAHSEFTSIPAHLGRLPIAGFAAKWAGSAEVPLDYSPDCDCTVTCCNDTTLSACGCCCDVHNANCGSCCDGGCCPGCSPPPPGD